MRLLRIYLRLKLRLLRIIFLAEGFSMTINWVERNGGEVPPPTTVYLDLSANENSYEKIILGVLLIFLNTHFSVGTTFLACVGGAVQLTNFQNQPPPISRGFSVKPPAVFIDSTWNI